MCDFLSNLDNQNKDWGVNELYNTLYSFLEDGGVALPGISKPVRSCMLLKVLHGRFAIWWNEGSLFGLHLLGYTYCIHFLSCTESHRSVSKFILPEALTH